ncbi:MAG: D-alanine--D-alanine ligase [Eubacteriales bacterium]|nr:D-alanine--D-alanine ligase [Eubacteriales bacterium]
MKIIVLAGGYSNERDVSLNSGAGVCKALRERGHQAFLLDPFMGFEYDSDKLEEAFDLPDGGLSIAKGIEIKEPDLDALWKSRPGDSLSYLGPNVLELCSMADITFMALHGSFGENGKLQAAFDVLGIRYTGPNSLGCALSMDKGVTKEIFKMQGVPTPDGTHLFRHQKDVSLDELGFRLPVVVKPCSGGSSLGVYIVHTEEEYKNAIESSFEKEDEVVIEPFIDGREYACGIIDGKALPLVEIVPKDGFFDYVNKYQLGGASEICPAQSLNEEQTKAIQAAGEKAFAALRLDVYSRADFIVDNHTGEFYCLEVNSLPGMTSASLLPKAAKAAGYEYGEFCELIIRKSIEARYQNS